MGLIEKIATVIAPDCCIVCGEEGKALCHWCWPDAFEKIPPTCFRCKTLTKNSMVCEKCKKSTNLSNIWIGSDYNKNMKKLITGLKYERRIDYHRLLASKIDEEAPYLDEYIVSWVSTTNLRKRQRGFDQAEKIARHFAKIRHMVAKPLLRRIDQEQQVGKSKEERMASNIKFVCVRDLSGLKILLVDDVITTGTTLCRAAKCLKEAGAAEVSALICATNYRAGTTIDKLI